MSEAVAAGARSSRQLSPAAAARLMALFLPLALLGGAFGSQYFGGLYPCEMCWWQRYAHMAALVPAALAFTAPAEFPRSRTLTLLAALGIARLRRHRRLSCGGRGEDLPGFHDLHGDGARAVRPPPNFSSRSPTRP